MRTKKAFANNLTAAILQVIILIFGLILPRLMISTYGSELNGLVSSTKQLVSYLQYLELGITSALIATLYRPLAQEDYDTINPLVTRAKKEYEKISFGYFIGVILLSLIYPLLLKEDLGYWNVAMLVSLVGIYGAIDFYSLSKYRVLLEADQKAYVIKLVTIVTTILQNVASIVFMIFDQSILLVVFIPTIFLPIRSIFLRLYIKKNYKQIEYSAKPVEAKLESRKDAFVSGLSTTLNVSLPHIIVSIMISLEMSSVFSVYSIVFIGLAGVLNVATSGMRSAFGNMIARGEKETVTKTYGYYVFLLYALIAILYSAALSLIIPFIKVYMVDADINYIYPMIGILFTVWSVIHNVGLPNQTMLNASGEWKIATKTNIIQAIILVILTLVLGNFLGVEGILVGMIIATAYKTIALMFLTNKNILDTSGKTSFLRLLGIYFIILLANVPMLTRLINIDVSNFIEWTIAAVIVVIWATAITVVVTYVFDRKTIKEIYSRYVKPIFKRIRKKNNKNI